MCAQRSHVENLAARIDAIASIRIYRPCRIVRVTSVGKYTLLQEFENREAPTYAARCEAADGVTQLVAIERYATDSTADAEDEASLEEAARRAQVLTDLYHPNLSTVRDVVVNDGEVLVVSAFVDGESYETLMPGGKGFAEFPFALKLAFIADAVEGLAALHEFARGRQTTIVHGGVTPRNVMVCADGRVRLARVCNLFPEQVSPASPTLGYIAPELLDPSRVPEPSVDVFGAGVMLWEVLAGKRLAVQTNAPLLLLKEFEKGPPRGIPQEDLGWAKGLIPIVERALSGAEKRYADAEQMARAMRAVFAAAGPAGSAGLGGRSRASIAEVADFVEQVAGDRIRERRAELGFIAPLPIHSSRATIAPKRSRPSLVDEGPFPLPPPVARIKLATMVDEDEYSSRTLVGHSDQGFESLQSFEASQSFDSSHSFDSGDHGFDSLQSFKSADQDDNLAALSPLMSAGDPLIVDVRSAELLWRGGEPTDERDALRSGVAEDELSRFSSFPPARAPRSPEPLFEDRRGRRPLLWGGVVLAIAIAIVFGYSLGRGQKSTALAPSVGGSPRLEVAKVDAVNIEAARPAETVQTAAPNPANEAPKAMAVNENAPPVAAEASPPQPEPEPTQIELVPEATPRGDVRDVRDAPRAASRRTRSSHGSRVAEAAPLSSAVTPTQPSPPPASTTPEPSASGNQEGRQKFNPQGI